MRCKTKTGRHLAMPLSRAFFVTRDFDLALTGRCANTPPLKSLTEHRLMAMLCSSFSICYRILPCFDFNTWLRIFAAAVFTLTGAYPGNKIHL